MDKENAVHIHHGILFGLKKGILSFMICEPGRHAKLNRPVTEGQILHYLPYICNLKKLNSQKQRVE